jgi:Uma2 family endonuclease
MTAHPARHDPRLWTADQFLEFYMTRPGEERWQLIDGLALMMTPPNLAHQRIASNVARLLNESFRNERRELFAYENVGLRLPGVPDFNPQPDVVVCTSKADYTYYQEWFLLVAEVLSPSNSAEMIERKLELYNHHPDNLYSLEVDQDDIHVTLYAREAGWEPVHLNRLDDVLTLPAFGFSAALAEIYAGTPLTR